MPILLPPLTRRRFLRGPAGAVLAAFPTCGLRATEDSRTDPHRYVFLSDTHIMESPTATARGINMADHLRRIVAEIAGEAIRPIAD